MGAPGGLPSKGLHRAGHDWSDLAAAAVPYINSLDVESEPGLQGHVIYWGKISKERDNNSLKSKRQIVKISKENWTYR